MNMYDIGARIKQRREQLGYTQDELGDILGLKKSSISRYESGDVKSLDVDSAVRFAKALKCDPVWLSGWKDADMIVENDVIDEIIKGLHRQPKLMSIVEKALKMKEKEIDKAIKILEVWFDDPE